MSDEPHLSVTQLKMYLRCPLQYFFRYACGLKTPPTGDLMLGRIVHDTLRENYRQKIQSRQDLPLQQLTDIFSDYWERQIDGTIFSDDEKPGQVKDEGVRMLTAYGKAIAPKVQPVAVEQEFLVSTGATALPLKGYIDLIDEQGLIIDHKTTKRSFPENSVAKDLQLTAYAMAFRALYGRDEKGVRFDVMVRSSRPNVQPRIQQLSGKRTQADIDRFLRLAQQLERGIKAETFYPSDNYMCGICGYGEMCEKW